MARGRWNLTSAVPQVDDFKLPKLSHVAKITGCEAVTISKLQMAEVGEGSEEGQARGWEAHVVELKACEMLAFGQWVQLDVGNELVPSPSPSCEALQSRQGGEVMESGASPVGMQFEMFEGGQRGGTRWCEISVKCQARQGGERWKIG